ncbi:ion channel [Paenibacillus sp. 1P07SE]|uniref:ion channel n=1 Tax=Paenibacillus sp. 1P07SE TaxID=3132209 RepID=UPI0039A6F985
MINTLLIVLTCLYMTGTLIYFLASKGYKKSYVNLDLFYKLFFVLLSITFGFAVIYYLLSFHEVTLRVTDHMGEEAESDFWTYLYFSGVTILAIGYGDLVPVGSTRFFAVIQASLGLLLPAAFFVKALNDKKD